MNTTHHITTLDQARAVYVAQRKLSQLSAEEFKARVISLVHELADGEEATPSLWARCACEVTNGARQW